MSNSMQQPQYAPSPPTNTLAVISLVASLLSWFMFPIIGALVGVVTGHMARREIKNSYGAQSGDGLAIAGLVLGYIHLAVSCLSALVFVLIFGGMIGLSGCAILAESAHLISSSDFVTALLSN